MNTRQIKIPWFHHILWHDVQPGDIVWLQGRAFGLPKAYGPFQVISKLDFKLRNLKGNKFMHMAEDLVLPTWG